MVSAPDCQFALIVPDPSPIPSPQIKSFFGFVTVRLCSTSFTVTVNVVFDVFPDVGSLYVTFNVTVAFHL